MRRKCRLQIYSGGIKWLRLNRHRMGKLGSSCQFQGQVRNPRTGEQNPAVHLETFAALIDWNLPWILIYPHEGNSTQRESLWHKLFLFCYFPFRHQQRGTLENILSLNSTATVAFNSGNQWIVTTAWLQRREIRQRKDIKWSVVSAVEELEILVRDKETSALGQIMASRHLWLLRLPFTCPHVTSLTDLAPCPSRALLPAWNISLNY